MEIKNFQVADDHSVSLEMRDMPREVRTLNTTVYIAGAPVGQPEEVSFGQQLNTFFAGTSDGIREDQRSGGY
jgi:hypothetical protein